MADQPWIKVPLSFLDKFGYTDKLFAAIELMRTADTITRRVDVSLHAIALRWGHDRRWARVFVRDIKTLCAACLLPPQHPPQHPLEVDFSGFYGGRSTPSSTPLAPPLGPESDLHNMEHAPARGSILKELKNKNHTPLEVTKTRKAPIPRSPFPEDFQPNDKDRVWFRKEFGDISEKLVVAETAAMIDWHTSKGTLFADHHAAWKTWMRNWRSGKFGRNNVPLSVKSPLRQLN